jgi:hypothetical protein
VVGFLKMTHISLIQYIQTGCDGPTQPVTQWVWGLLPWKWIWPLQTNVEVKKAWSCPATLYAIMTCTEKNLCPFDVGIKYSLLWYESVVLLGIQISVKMELLINHVEVLVLLQINPQLMYSTVISVERSSWTKPGLSHILSNMLVPLWSRCFLIILWFSSYLRNV